MPSREEIVKWLNEAAGHFDSVGYVYKSNYALTIKNKYLERATQVEAMTCETCKHYDVEYFLCTVIGDSGGMVPEDFGCFSHEPKEDK